MESTIHELVETLTRYAKSQSVLYAEDEDAVRAQVELFLRKFFGDVRVCSNGLEAWQAYQERPCDVLVTDISMPQMDGIELCEKVVGENPYQKIVVISAHNESERLMKLINIGVDRFLLKPFDNRRFLRALHGLSLELYERAENTRLQEQLKLSLETTQHILDILDEALVIVENSCVVRANRKFLQLAGALSIEAFNEAGGRIDKLFVPARGYLMNCGNAELIEKLKDGEDLKVLVRESGGMKILQPHINKLDTCSDLISLVDITSVEKELLTNRQKLLTNPFTGLPNKSALFEKMQDMASKYPVTIVLVAILDYQKVVKWLGKQRANNAEKFAVEKIKELLADKKIQLLYFANYDQNKFVILTNKNDSKSIVALLNNHEFPFSYSNDSENGMFDTLNIKLQAITKSFPVNETMLVIVDTIEKEFGAIS
jgi:two-component system, cell cycle response regulator